MKNAIAVCALFAALVFLGAQAVAQGDNPVSVRLEIYVVSEVGGEERFTQSDTARPGQTIEYRLFVRNEDATTLPAGLVEVLGPILEGTTFVPNSATPTSDRVLTEYTIDNQVFGEPPLVLTEGGNRRVVDPTEYRAVRWTLLVPMEPGEEVTFVYRVVLDAN
jgi:uncharacterized repeat protein (TIGR01451 family)